MFLSRASLDLGDDSEGAPKVPKKGKASAKVGKGRAGGQEIAGGRGERIRARHGVGLPMALLRKTLFEWHHHGKAVNAGSNGLDGSGSASIRAQCPTALRAVVR
jgi:hypothetical protein